MTTRILVIGDAMLDVWRHYSKSLRVNPEAPGAPITHLERVVTSPGAGLNVAANLAALGHKDVYFLDPVVRPRRDNGRYMRLVNDAGFALTGLIDHDGTPLTRKIRHVVDDVVVMREDHDTQPRVTCHAAQLVNELTVLKPDFIVLSDYNKGALFPPHVADAVIAWAHRYGSRLIVDAKQGLLAYLTLNHAGRFDEYDTLKCNQHELAKFNDPDTLETWHARWNDLWTPVLVQTRGAGGTRALIEDEPHLSIDLEPFRSGADPVGVVGAGDVWTAAYVASLVTDDGRHDAIDFATQVASRTVFAPYAKAATLVTKEYFSL
jgi:bifunctional ADP-heptose synthase (sugar kinase/adenylyltransferase)